MIRFIVTLTTVVTVILIAFLADSPIKDEAVIDKFELYKEDFEKINKYIIENYSNSPEENYILIDTQIYQIVGLYDGGKIALDKEIKLSLNSIVPAFDGYDFSFIQVSDGRVAYGGEGYRMYVYSRNGKAPNYYYNEGDGMHPDVYELGDNWYLLKVNFR